MRGRGHSQGTRKQVLSAAMRKFSEKSFLGATTAEIAVEIQVKNVKSAHGLRARCHLFTLQAWNCPYIHLFLWAIHLGTVSGAWVTALAI